MDDIDKKALIDEGCNLLNEAIAKIRKAQKLFKKCGIEFCDNVDALAIADHLINNGVTVQDWVSVDDRLPEYSNDGFADAVLVTDGFVQHMAYFVGGEWRFAESGEIKEPMWYRITHWMPLPQPPKGE